MAMVEKKTAGGEVSINDAPETKNAEPAEDTKELAAISKRAQAKSRREDAADNWRKDYSPCCWGISCGDYTVFVICFAVLYAIVGLLVFTGLSLNIVSFISQLVGLLPHTRRNPPQPPRAPAHNGGMACTHVAPASRPRRDPVSPPPFGFVRNSGYSGTCPLFQTPLSIFL